MAFSRTGCHAPTVCSNWEGVICSSFLPLPHLPPLWWSQASTSQVSTSTAPLTAPLCDLAHLTHLYLRFNLYAQPFPTFLLSSCPLLLVLDLSQNWFSGPIPDNISALSRLQFLSLKGNSFEGPIPPQPGNLVLLPLRGNTLFGTIPSPLGNLSSLQTLDLNCVSFDAGTVPPELGNLTSLQVLDSNIATSLALSLLP